MVGVSTLKAQGTRVLDATIYPVQGAYQQLAVDTATALTVPDDAILIIVLCQTQAVRWRDDGTSPTATVGMPMAVGEKLIYNGDLTKIKFISQTSGGVVNISYYK